MEAGDGENDANGDEHVSNENPNLHRHNDRQHHQQKGRNQELSNDTDGHDEVGGAKETRKAATDGSNKSQQGEGEAAASTDDATSPWTVKALRFRGEERSLPPSPPPASSPLEGASSSPSSEQNDAGEDARNNTDHDTDQDNNADITTTTTTTATTTIRRYFRDPVMPVGVRNVRILTLADIDDGDSLLDASRAPHPTEQESFLIMERNIRSAYMLEQEVDLAQRLHHDRRRRRRYICRQYDLCPVGGASGAIYFPTEVEVFVTVLRKADPEGDEGEITEDLVPEVDGRPPICQDDEHWFFIESLQT